MSNDDTRPDETEPDEETSSPRPAASTAVAEPGAPDDLDDLDDLDDDEPEERRRIVVIAGVAFVIIALLGFVLTRDAGNDEDDPAAGTTETTAVADEPAEGETVSIVGTNDTFDRADTAGGVDALPSGAEWEFPNGTWDVREGEVALVAPSATRNFMVVDVGYTDQQSQVRLAKATNGAGLAFRYQDEFHYWAIEPVPEFATLNIIKVDTEPQGPEGSLGVFDQIDNVPVADGATIGVVLTGTQIQIVVDGKVVKTIDDDYLAGTGKVGFTARGTDEVPTVGDARWDDFTAGGPTGEGIIGSNEREIAPEGEEPPPEGDPTTTEG
ncbi:MAG: hypothetical protein ACR2JF_15050 [Iamia sp.]